MSNPLITVDGLLALEGPRILDVRWKLGGPPGADEFRAGHLPGAVYVDLDEELAAPAGPGGRHPLPGAGDLRRAARGWGLNDGDTVVAYDDAGLLSAARLWWLLRWAGFDGEVRLLDGGLRAWTEAGQPLETGDAPRPAEGDVTLGEGQVPTLGVDDVEGFVSAGGLLLDARPAQRYTGEVASVDPRPGHIPGAVSAPAVANLAEDGRFADPRALAARFAGLGVGGDREVGVYCGSGVTAAHDLVALAVAGIDPDRVALYPGSYSQWASLPSTPVVTGHEPG
ncbi:sulfurtransferase [Kineosporia succinea]|uniref:Thiosulfate/3-mercaptopyruvate sulfurtransferase n=1 Tax=Kineosporia succinea TaxID=84632 RepID=A0ABT9P4N4_9ACTN|nr:sulfurtransferase [Kineosporia succinea]MDP9827632.1 thiosulfate/3-mercaptopyruvate sulfurtransferase [Kineosporia succinea]